MFRNSIKYFIAIIGLVSCSFGQDLQADLATIANAMAEAESVSLNVDVTMYASKGGAKVYSSNAVLDKKGESTRSVIGEMEFINTANYELRIDHEERGVLILKKEKEQKSSKKSKKQKMDVDIETLKEFFDQQSKDDKVTIQTVNKSESNRKYSVSGVQGMKQVTVSLDVSSNKLKQITYEYNSDGGNQYVVLNYSTFHYNKDVSASLDLTNYFSEKGNEYVLNDRLKGYHIYTEK